jgi:hypothetical protein
VQSSQPGDIDGSESRDITLTLGEHTLSFKGQPYLLHFVLPNFYFHCTTAYDILRHCGVELGKRDFIGCPAPIVDLRTGALIGYKLPECGHQDTVVCETDSVI